MLARIAALAALVTLCLPTVAAECPEVPPELFTQCAPEDCGIESDKCSDTSWAPFGAAPYATDCAGQLATEATQAAGRLREFAVEQGHYAQDVAEAVVFGCA